MLLFNMAQVLNVEGDTSSPKVRVQCPIWAGCPYTIWVTEYCSLTATDTSGYSATGNAATAAAAAAIADVPSSGATFTSTNAANGLVVLLLLGLLMVVVVAVLL